MVATGRTQTHGGTRRRRALRWLAVAAGPALLAACGQGDGVSPALIAANDRGVALMGRYEYTAAEEVFAEVAGAAPHWLDARVNLAIATLNRQRDGDEALALDILATVLAEDPQHRRALYASGILRFHGGEIEAATALFRQVAAADPRDAYAAYFLGQTLLQSGDAEAAAQWFEKAVELDPNLISAYYTASLAFRRLGRAAEAARMLEDWQRYRASPAARTAKITYMQMGPKAEALAVSPIAAAPAALPQGPLFEARRVLDADIRAGGGWTLTAVDLQGDGEQTLVAASAAGIAVFAGADGDMRRVDDHPLHRAGPARAALWGDLDADGLTDVVLCDEQGVRRWRQMAKDWRGLGDLGDRPCAAAALFDADHDGDLDVFATGAHGNALYNNNGDYNNDGDGSFRDLAEEADLRGGHGRQVLVADFDGDRDLDILVLNQAPPHDLWRNDLGWRYAALAGLDDLRGTALAAVVVFDSDADGHREVYGATPAGDILRWRYDGVAWTREMVMDAAAAETKPAEALPQSLDVADFDGDGALELLRQRGAELAIVDPRSGEIRWRQTVAGLSTARAAVLHPRRGPSLVAVADDGLLLWPPGAGRHEFLAVAPVGRDDDSQMRSNASGIGTHVRVRFGGRWSVFDAVDPHSGPGQSLQPLSVGLAGQPQAGFVALDWSDGVSQTELELAAGERHVIVETQRQLASCPVFFVWDGSGYRFVSDVLGGAALGYLVGPGEYAPPRPFESFLLDAGALVPRNGRYVVKLGEPMEEAAYLDAAELAVYDLPAGWSMVLDERLAVGGAPATGRPMYFRRSASPARVTAANGSDVTALATAADRRAPPPGAVDPRFIGLLRTEQVLTLTFATPLEGERPVLVADGWVEYPYSQTVFAAWQAGVRYQAPTVAARGADGAWRPLAVEFGYPAGMPRRMALPLPPLPPGTTTLRLSSNMEIYWDNLRIVWEEELQPTVATAQLLAARVARTGFAKRSTGAQRLPHYDYDQRAATWDAKTPAGFYTALGDAAELVQAVDGGLAVFGSGEEVHLEFAAAPDPPPGHQRYFALRFHGWAKDMDLYTRHGHTVAPMPAPNDVAAEALARGQALNERYNVRFAQGL